MAKHLSLPNGSHILPSSSPVVVPVAVERPTTTYYLPSGEPVELADDLTHGAPLVSFQLLSGKTVYAKRGMVRPTVKVDAIIPSKATLLGHGGY